MRTAKLGRLDFEREKISNKKKIAKRQHYYRRAIRNPSFTWKDPEGSHGVAVMRRFVLAVLFPSVKGSHFHRFMETIVFISDIQKLSWQFGLFVFYGVCFEKGS